MSEYDNRLVRESEVATEWQQVNVLHLLAESDEARDILRKRIVDLYRHEEYSAGLL